MNEQVMQWVVSVCSTLTALLITFIWNEVKGMRSDIKLLSLTQTRQEKRVDMLEKMMDKLPCVRNLKCPSKE